MIQVSFADISITTSTFDSQPVWAEWDYGSGDTILLSTLAGTFYRSVGGRNFVDQTSLIPDWGAVNAPFQRSGLRGVVATNDANKLYLVGFSNIWVTSDAGATYQKRPYDSTLIINAILPHPYNSDIALMSSYTMSCYSSDKSTCYQRLFVTTDFGLTWRAIATYVQRYRWASNANNQVPRIYASIFATKSGNQFNLPAQNAALYLSDDYFNTNRLLLSNVSSFAIKSNFVDAAYHSTSGQAEMWTSGNYGKSFIHFDVPNWAYAIVLTPYVSSQTIFMMPSSQLPTYSMFGQAWHSDVTGANFVRSSSIMSVLSSGVEFHYDPLIPGVFFANFVEMGSSGPVRYTQVSRNNGGSWALLPAPTIDSTGRPTNCDLSRGCSLHLVLALTQPGSFVINPTSPGVIICRGNYGMFYNPDPTAQNTFISSDAGSTWREIAKGSQTTAIAEYGSLIVAAPLTSPTSTISYSFDQGASWSTYPLGSTEQILIVVSSPSNDTGVFLALSTRKAFILNFPKNLVRTCSSSDYYTWSPKDPLGHNCLLGTTWIVTSRQPSSACIPGGPPAPIRYGASCSCTACDYECAFGYAAIPPSPDCTPLEYPTRSPSQPSTTRRISGDGCSSARSEIDIAVV